MQKTIYLLCALLIISFIGITYHNYSRDVNFSPSDSEGIQ